MTVLTLLGGHPILAAQPILVKIEQPEKCDDVATVSLS